ATSPATLSEARQVIERRVEALGATESQVHLAGSSIDVTITALDAGSIENRGGQSCAVTTDSEELGCFPDRADAEQAAQERAVDRTLDVIGKTAWLEEREVFQVYQPGDPGSAQLEMTAVDPETGRFVPLPGTQAIVSYEDTNDDGRFTSDSDVKYLLGG